MCIAVAVLRIAGPPSEVQEISDYGRFLEVAIAWILLAPGDCRLRQISDSWRSQFPGVCRLMQSFLREQFPKSSTAALANDMMILCAPRILYERSSALMEMICASVCLTTIVSFNLERNYHIEGRLFDLLVHEGK